MTIRKKAGKWHYRFRLHGKRFEGTTGLDATKANEGEARSIEASKRLEAVAGLAPASGVTFEWATRNPQTGFLLFIRGEYRAHPNTWRRIQTSFASISQHFAGYKLTRIDHASVEAYKAWRMSEHQVAPVTLANDLNALSLFLSYCIKMGWLQKGRNCLLGEMRVKRPSREDAIRMHIVTAEEEERYFKFAKPGSAIADVARLILNQGMRPDEALSLAKRDYNKKDGTVKITVGKSKAARRTLYLLPESAAILDRRMRVEGFEDSQWFFPSRHAQDGLDRHVVQIDHSHDTICSQANLFFVVYDFRHTWATRALCEAQMDLASAAAILGHSDLSKLKKYVHPTAQHQRAAMEKYSQLTKGGLRLVKKKA